MKNLSTGTGIALLAGAIVAYPILDRVMPKADANVTQAAAVVAAVSAQAGPTIVWMGVAGGGVFAPASKVLFRLWSDGRIEYRHVGFGAGTCCDECGLSISCTSNWIEIPPPPSGNGFACRTDLDGNRVVDGADLGLILANWGPQTPCNPEPEYPCMTIAGGSGLLK